MHLKNKVGKPTSAPTSSQSLRGRVPFCAPPQHRLAVKFLIAACASCPEGFLLYRERSFLYNKKTSARISDRRFHLLWQEWVPSHFYMSLRRYYPDQVASLRRSQSYSQPDLLQLPVFTISVYAVLCKMSRLSRCLTSIIVTILPAPFVKPHCVLIVANATVLLIERHSAHTDVRAQKHTSMFYVSRTLYG